MRPDEFQEQIESNFDKQQQSAINALHEEFQLKHNDIMQDPIEKIAGQPDIKYEDLPEPTPYEYVDKPKHYNFFDMQAIDVIKKTLTHDQYQGFLMGNSLKYRLRMGNHKPGESGVKDLQKAKYYEKLWGDYINEDNPF